MNQLPVRDRSAFRSQAIAMEVALNEKVKQLDPKRSTAVLDAMEIHQALFNDIIAADSIFSKLLGMIKVAYDKYWKATRDTDLQRIQDSLLSENKQLQHQLDEFSQGYKEVFDQKQSISVTLKETQRQLQEEKATVAALKDELLKLEKKWGVTTTASDHSGEKDPSTSDGDGQGGKKQELERLPREKLIGIIRDQELSALKLQTEIDLARSRELEAVAVLEKTRASKVKEEATKGQQRGQEATKNKDDDDDSDDSDFSDNEGWCSHRKGPVPVPSIVPPLPLHLVPPESEDDEDPPPEQDYDEAYAHGYGGGPYGQYPPHDPYGQQYGFDPYGPPPPGGSYGAYSQGLTPEEDAFYRQYANASMQAKGVAGGQLPAPFPAEQDFR